MVEKFQANLKCVWRLYWWKRPDGRAFEMTMCALKARLLNQKVHLDLRSCKINCGSGFVDFNAAMHSV